MGLAPDLILPPDIDENPRKGELPRPYAARLAREKALAVAAGPEDVVLCADTTVALGRRILGKPADAAEAAAFLALLGGRRHEVITAVAVRRGDRLWQRENVSVVKMKRLSDAEMNAYLASGEWQGKAGGLWHPGDGGGADPVDPGQFQRDHGPAGGRNRGPAGVSRLSVWRQA